MMLIAEARRERLSGLVRALLCTRGGDDVHVCMGAADLAARMTDSIDAATVTIAAIPGALVQMGFATLLGFGLASMLG